MGKLGPFEIGKVHEADCLEAMKQLPDHCVDAVVTDPPYGLKFMGKEWDHGIPGEPFWREALRVAKPGTHLLAFGGTRTFHRLACAIEDAGWRIQNCLCWLYGQGYPAGTKNVGNGWSTRLKPAWEPIILARTPLDGTVIETVQKWGTGAINVGGCRIPTTESLNGGAYTKEGHRSDLPGASRTSSAAGMLAPGRTADRPFVQPSGRWPSNLILDEEVGKLLDEQSGYTKTKRNEKPSDCGGKTWGGTIQGNRGARGYTDEGGASRFFYCAKASPKERGESNAHPTVKPLALMRWLCRLVTPPNGIVLDPFAGSGSTGCAAIEEGFEFIGMDNKKEYVETANKRISASKPPEKENLDLFESKKET